MKKKVVLWMLCAVIVIPILVVVGFPLLSYAAWGIPPTYTAAAYHQGWATKLMVSMGANPNATPGGVPNHTCNDTPLSMAVVTNDLDLARWLIRHGAKADVMIFCDMGTALGLAVSSGWPDMTKLLVQSGADVNATGTWHDQPPLMYAVQNGDAEITQLLLDAGADPQYVSPPNTNGNTPSGWTVMHALALSQPVSPLTFQSFPLAPKVRFGNPPYRPVTTGELLLKTKAEIDPATAKGVTPLISVLYNGNLDVLRFFLENGADANVDPKDGRRPLHRLSQWALFPQSAVDLAKKENSRALKTNWTQDAVNKLKEDRFKAAELLLAHGADINARDNKGRTPLTVIREKDKELAAFLKERGAVE